MYKEVIILSVFLLANISIADKFIPHFASIKSSEVNVRKGPNVRYKIDWVFKKKGEPVEVIAQFEHWNRIRDVTGDEGWVKSVMLSKKRTGVILVSLPKKTKATSTKLYANLYSKPGDSSSLIAKIEASKRVHIEQCQKQWCRIRVSDHVGWIEKKHIWGVSVQEEFKK